MEKRIKIAIKEDTGENAIDANHRLSREQATSSWQALTYPCSSRVLSQKFLFSGS